MFKLSVIIPFRCENLYSNYLFVRLQELIELLPNHNEIEFMVVDSGSLPEVSSVIKELCVNNGITYIYQDTVGQPFSLGGCRDFGVQYAKGEAISFLDVDLRMSPSFWDGLLNLMRNWGISSFKKSFLAVPCLYLTQEGTEVFLSEDNNENKYSQLYLEYLQGKMENVESFAHCSSVMVVDKLHYLSIGGHNPEFNGHGYEDFELYHRLMVEEAAIPRANDYLKDTKTWNTSTYNGFRSQMTIIARPALALNLMVFHLWHPRPKQSSFYNPKKLAENRERIFKSFSDFDKNKNHPKPLATSECIQHNFLFFTTLNSNFFNCMRDLIPILGNPVCVNEFDYFDVNTEELSSNFFEMLHLLNIKKIVFPNPYGNEGRKAIYDWCRENDFPYVVFERGALPDSWFLDAKGFNADSDTYKTINYDEGLTTSEFKKVQEYISHCVTNSEALEQQGNRVGGEALLHKLNISGKKVLFVPLQRPSDTVIKFFCGDVGSYNNFIRVIDDLAKVLKEFGWVTLVKKHPLETDLMTLKNAVYVPNDTHFLDLIEVSDACALINSGVGVYSMMMGKPCYIFGEAFYSIADVNYQVKANEYLNKKAIHRLACKIAKNEFIFNQNKAYTFINFLINKFYSFGKSTVTQRVEVDKSLRSITTKINFYKIVKNGEVVKKYNAIERPKLHNSAMLFERFALDILASRKNVSEVKKSSTLLTENMVKPQAKAVLVDKSETTMKKVTGTLKIKDRKIANTVRKINKFKRDPYRFFADSKNTYLQKIRVFFE